MLRLFRDFTKIALALLCVPEIASAQAKQFLVNAPHFRVRILWPANSAVGLNTIAHLRDIILSHVSLPGVPSDQFADTTITLTFASEMSAGIDAWVRPDGHLIILSLSGIRQWEPSKLRQIVEHELAHLELEGFLGNQDLPAWFREGMAEWWSAGLTCEGTIRIQLDMAQRYNQPISMPKLFGPEGFKRSRLAYDYLASYFDWIDRRRGGVVADGQLLRAVKRDGLDAALTLLLRESAPTIRRRWWSYMLKTYDSLAASTYCSHDSQSGAADLFQISPVQ
jgi:hypothetical protein